MKTDFSNINILSKKINELEIKLRIKKSEKEKLYKKIDLDIKDIDKSLESLYKKSQKLRKERERLEINLKKELDKIG